MRAVTIETKDGKIVGVIIHEDRPQAIDYAIRMAIENTQEGSPEYQGIIDTVRRCAFYQEGDWSVQVEDATHIKRAAAREGGEASGTLPTLLPTNASYGSLGDDAELPEGTDADIAAINARHLPSRPNTGDEFGDWKGSEDIRDFYDRIEKR